MPRLVTSGDVSFGDRCAFRTLRIASHIGAENGGALRVGARTFINEGCTIVATSRIDIGVDCRIGEFVAIYDSSYHQVGPHEVTRSGHVVLGDNVWIARGVVVLPGVTIARNSVVAANSVVTHDVPENTVVAGNPARPIRTFESTDGWRRG